MKDDGFRRRSLLPLVTGLKRLPSSGGHRTEVLRRQVAQRGRRPELRSGRNDLQRLKLVM